MGRYSGKKCRLVSMFGLTSSFFLVEIVVGYVTNSMALVADSFHMLSDIAALIIAFLSVKMAPKSWDKNTYGWARAEVLGALVNAVFLVALCFSITVESLKRFYEPEEIHDPQMILYVGAMGLLVNLLGLCLFHEHGHSHGGGGGGGAHGHSHGKARHTGTHSHLTVMADDDDEDEADHGHGHSHAPGNGGCGGGAGDAEGGKADKKAAVSSSQMNMRGVFLHVLADALGSVVVIISALIMWLTEWKYRFYVDPGLSLVLVLLMMKSVWPLLMESALILLQTVPTHIEVDTLKKKLLENIEGVLAVHEFHVWQLTGDRIIASAHIRCLNLSEYMKVAENIKEFFHNEGIHSTTIQPEFLDYHPGRDYVEQDDCALSCPKGPGGAAVDPSCDSSKCCPVVNGTKSASNTPVMERRQSQANMERRQSQANIDPEQQQQRRRSSAVHTSTPNRRSAPNLSSLTNDNDLPMTNELTAELDLSDPGLNISGVSPLKPLDSPEETVFITPRANSRVVRIISKQSNV